LARWLQRLEPEQRPMVVCLFLSDRWNRVGARPEEPAELAVTAHSLGGLDPAAAARLTLCAATPGLAEELSARLAWPARSMPAHLVYSDFGPVGSQPSPRSFPRKPVVAMLGGARPEKGSHLIPAIVAACRDTTRVCFLVQAFNETCDRADFRALHALHRAREVKLLRGAVGRRRFLAALSEADMLLFPYDRLPYRQRNSGVFCEAVAAAKPVVAPRGTWLGGEIDDGRASGVSYDGEGPEVIAEAVGECARRLPELSVHAHALAPAWRAEQSLTAFLDAVDELVAK
jgi:glycosyltransferase involved in cell wall biosynthesis